MKTLSKELLAILACPKCKGDLVYDPKKLSCRKCKKSYPIKDGVPVFI